MKERNGNETVVGEGKRYRNRRNIVRFTAAKSAAWKNKSLAAARELLEANS